jgi:hypothetical protein
VFDLLLKDRDVGLVLIIAVLGALIGLAALFGVLMPASRRGSEALFMVEDGTAALLRQPAPHWPSVDR